MAAIKKPASETTGERSYRLMSEYETGLRIDKNALDDELVDHPERLYHVTEEHALAMSYRDEAETRVAEARAVADDFVRRTLTGYGDKKEKVTEAQVKAGVALERPVVEAADAYNGWSLLTHRWAGLTKAFEARGRALDSLVKLYGTNYFANNSGGAAGSDARERVAADIRKQSDAGYGRHK